MDYVRLHVQLLTHPKQLQTTDKAWRALTLAWMWSGEHETDGHIPRPVGQLLRITPGVAKELISLGWMHPVDGGWELHDWTEHQVTQADLEAKRARDRGRQAAKRSRDKQDDTTNGVTRDVTRDTTRDSHPKSQDPVTRDSRLALARGRGRGRGREEPPLPPSSNGVTPPARPMPLHQALAYAQAATADRTRDGVIQPAQDTP